MTFQSKVFLGVKVITEDNPLLEEQQGQPPLKFGYFGSVRMRQAGAIMTSELKSSEDALVVMTSLEDTAERIGYEFTESEKITNALLQTLFQDSAAALTPIEKEHLKSELLWFGELALHPQPKNPQTNPDAVRDEILEGVKSTAYTVAGLTFGVLAALILGVVGFIVMMVMYSHDKLIMRTQMYTGGSSVYLESFTVWMLSFVVFSWVLGSVAPDTNLLVANVIVFLSSFVAGMLWAALRGKLDGQSRSDIGYCGNPIQELPVAIWCYVCSLPLVAFGLIISGILMFYSAGGGDGSAVLESSAPSHPLLEWVMVGDTTSIALVFFIACFCAPLVEETMFRGFFYRSIKDGSHRTGHFASTVIAATINGFIFAAIHPQGVFYIPSLCALGMAFSFAREWRGTLWTPIFMHALHNGIITCVLVFVVSA